MQMVSAWVAASPDRRQRAFVSRCVWPCLDGRESTTSPTRARPARSGSMPPATVAGGVISASTVRNSTSPRPRTRNSDPGELSRGTSRFSESSRTALHAQRSENGCARQTATSSSGSARRAPLRRSPSYSAVTKRRPARTRRSRTTGVYPCHANAARPDRTYLIIRARPPAGSAPLSAASSRRSDFLTRTIEKAARRSSVKSRERE